MCNKYIFHCIIHVFSTMRKVRSKLTLTIKIQGRVYIGVPWVSPRFVTFNLCKILKCLAKKNVIHFFYIFLDTHTSHLNKSGSSPDMHKPCTFKLSLYCSDVLRCIKYMFICDTHLITTRVACCCIFDL